MNWDKFFRRLDAGFPFVWILLLVASVLWCASTLFGWPWTLGGTVALVATAWVLGGALEK